MTKDRREFVRMALAGEVSPDDVVEAVSIDPELSAALAAAPPQEPASPPPVQRDRKGRFDHNPRARTHQKKGKQ